MLLASEAPLWATALAGAASVVLGGGVLWAFRYGARISKAVDSIERATNHVGDDEPTLIDQVRSLGYEQGEHGRLLLQHSAQLERVEAKADAARDRTAELADKVVTIGLELSANTAITAATREATAR